MRTDYSLNTTKGGRPRRPIEIMMTPMIDVIFLLLVFFLATSSFQVAEKLLPSSVSRLNESQSGMDAPPEEPTDDAVEQVIVKLSKAADATGILITMNGGAVSDLAALQRRLDAMSRVRSDVPVIIDPEPDVAMANVVAAYDRTRQTGLTRVYLATRTGD